MHTGEPTRHTEFEELAERRPRAGATPSGRWHHPRTVVPGPRERYCSERLRLYSPAWMRSGRVAINSAIAVSP